MPLLRNAVDAVQRNLYAVGLYCGAAAVLIALKSLVDSAAIRMTGTDYETLQDGVYGLLITIVLLTVQAVIQCVAFARMGRDIDKPLWRIPSDLEAIRRFFPMWLIMNLVLFASSWLANPDLYGGKPNAITALCIISALIMNIVCVPIGACVMFAGSFRWQRLGEALTPLTRQLSHAGAVLVLCLFQLFLNNLVAAHIYADSGVRGPFDFLGQRLGLTIVVAYLDCTVFAAVWLLCMADRETPDDIDFDF